MSPLGSVTPIRARGPRTAFVLSGGASLGALQVGMLRALYERGVVPDLLVGTFVGALNAAFVASRPQAPQTAAALARVWRGLRREDVFPVSGRALVSGLRGLEADLARYSREVELIVPPAPNPTDVQPTDFEHSSRLIGAAYAAGQAHLAAPHHGLRAQAA